MIATPEFKVGALVVIVAGIIAIMSLKVSEGPGVFSGTNDYWFDVDDASGLVKKSTVRSAGIDVGVIDDIKLVNGKARIFVKLNGDVPVKVSGTAEIRANGILGDKYIEIIPGSPTESPLPSGGQILSAREKGSINAVVNEVAQITDSLKSLAETLDKAAKNGDNSTSIGRIIHNIEVLTRDLSEVSGANKEKINSIISKVEKISGRLDYFLSDESPEGFSHGWQKAVNSLSRIDTSLRNIEEITHKINSGEGTIGRLVNDEETVEKINTAVDNVNEFLGGVDKLQTSFDYHSEYLADASMVKSYLSVRIQPGLDRYYEIGVVDDPRGVLKERNDKITGTSSSDTTTITTDKNAVKFTALFAKNFYDFTVKGGIIESSGGVAFDYHFWRRRFMLSLEAFNFDDVNVRSFLKYNVTNGIYLVGGGDYLTSDSKRSSFLGAGIFITNDDLKTFASKVSF